MGKRKQHPLIIAMNKFDALLAGLDSSNAEAFTAYVRNKVAVRRSKSKPSSAEPPLSKQKCATCGGKFGDATHTDTTYIGYHPFASPSPALPARRKSSSGNAPQTGTGASSGTETGVAGAAAAGSSGD